MSPTDLRREADAIRAELKRLKRVLATIDKQLPKVTKGPLRAEIEAMRRESQASYDEAEANLSALDAILEAERLPEDSAIGTIGSMDAVKPSQGGAVSAGKTKAPTRFQKALQKRGMSLPEWVATKVKFHLNLETAKNWVKKPGKGGRAVPRLWADRIAGEFGDPALSDPAHWPNGIRD